MNKYTNKKIIGIGLTSIVYKAYDSNKNPVAIKKIKSDNISDKFKSEIDIIKSLDNKYILKFIEIIKHKETIYIISELCDYPLSKIINNIENENEIMSIMYQLKEGLKYLYENNILHRDLKPDNILILNNTIKIADFGFAKIFNKNDTMLNTFCGTPNYMAPEILLTSSYDAKSDLWSLGMILYQMIYKNFPFKNIDNIIELTKHYKNNDIHFGETKYSDNLMNLLKSLLIIDYKKRMTWDELFNYPFIKKEDIKIDSLLTTEKSVNIKSRIIENYIPSENKEIKITNINNSIIENYFSAEKEPHDIKMPIQSEYEYEKSRKKKFFFPIIDFIRNYYKI